MGDNYYRDHNLHKQWRGREPERPHVRNPMFNAVSAAIKK
jgi:hypothetical protein